MEIYIKNDIEDKYIEFSEPLDPSLYSNIGITWEDYLSGKWVKLTDEQVRYKEENENPEIKDVFFMKKIIEKSRDELLNDAKFEKENEILSYDKSYIINTFYIGNNPIWFDKNERSGLIMRFEAEKKLGISKTKIWYHDMVFEFPIEEAEKIIYSVEVYASRCFDTTKNHIVNIKRLKKLEEVETYDFTLGYPEKLTFKYA